MPNPEFLTPKQIRPDHKISTDTKVISAEEEKILLALELIEKGQEDWVLEKDPRRFEEH